jgi:predicted nucleic acid-binding Zn ribbon protein
VLRRQPLSDGKVRFAWTAVVGAALSRVTTVRLRSDGTLLVRATSDAWRRETYRSRRIIRERLTELLGKGVVRKIDVKSEGAEHHASSGHRQRRPVADRQVSRGAQGPAGDGSRIARRP